ncbi:MAG: YcjX family protein [Mariprofundus sp.]|nr:YcjX family protein [Mariprofundus sp.]
MSWSDQLWSKAKQTGNETLTLLDSGYNQAQRRLEMASNRRVCIGITGLSKSGKTSFITSLINQLLCFDKANLSGFSPFVDDRIISVKQLPLEGKLFPAFPYDEFYQTVASAEPAWPIPTKAMSGCLLEIRMRHHEKSVNPFRGDTFTLKLEIRDYPGEWLLDLPMLDLSYRAWCMQSLAQYSDEPRKQLMGDLLTDLQQLDPFAKADLATIEELNGRYKVFLKRCKSHGNTLGFIQPGRFLIPGAVENALQLCFIPLLMLGQCNEEDLKRAAPDSYYKVNLDRYNEYINALVRPFFHDFFSDIDRQLVLVDVIQALYGGPDAINDLREAMNRISKCFAYGKSGVLDRLFAPKVDRVIYAATKIDQVTADDHESVRQLLASVVRKSLQDIKHQGVATKIEATSAVRSSKQLVYQGYHAVEGLDLTGKPLRYINPTIPDRIPESDAEWEPLVCFSSPVLRPAAGLSYLNQDAFPHIRMDSVLDDLIGDKCQ